MYLTANEPLLPRCASTSGCSSSNATHPKNSILPFSQLTSHHGGRAGVCRWENSFHTPPFACFFPFFFCCRHTIISWAMCHDLMNIIYRKKNMNTTGRWRSASCATHRFYVVKSWKTFFLFCSAVRGRFCCGRNVMQIVEVPRNSSRTFFLS